MKTKNLKRRIVVGDVHGELGSLKEILIHAKLIDQEENWAGECSVLIQTDDVIDRGPDSWGCIEFLQKIQEQAQDAGGQVVRLCGNHEVMLMEDSSNRYVNFKKPEKLASLIKEEISLGKIQASYTDGERLYTHAGLRSEIRAALEKEIGAERVDLKRLSDHINKVFRDAVKKKDFETHAIFHVDLKRGGSHEVGGIFWGDYSLICDSLMAYNIPQIFGHTPTRKKGVMHSHSFKLIDIDAGMHDGYGGNILYLEIGKSGNILQHHKDRDVWIETVLGPEKEKR